MTIADEPGQERPGPAPEKYGTDVIVLAYAGILVAAGGSLTFNIWHAAHKGHLQIMLAVIYGFLPPFLATILAHLAAATKAGTWGRAWVFNVTAGAMFVSAYATSQVVEPVSGLAVGVIFSLVADAASMTCLFVLLKAYAAAAAYKQWLTSVVPGTGAGPGNHDAGSGNRGQGGAGSPGAVPETSAGNQDASSPHALTGQRAASRSDGQLPRARASQPPLSGPGESREAVAAELAAQAKPAVESTAQREQRALTLLRDFRARTGQRMNNGELARALGVRKAGIGSIRAAIRDREEAA